MSPLEVTIRPAVYDDCAHIAALYSIASDGVADYVWSTLAGPGERLLDVGVRRYQSTEGPFSYRNCHVAVTGDQVVGMLVAYPMQVDAAGNDQAVDPVLAPYARLELDNSLYISGMAVYSDYRGQGIGTRLLELADQMAGRLALPSVSLIVFEQNTAAARLYRRHGYRELKRAKVVPHPMLRHGGDALLMGKPV